MLNIFLIISAILMLLAGLVAYNFLKYRYQGDKTVLIIYCMVILIVIQFFATLFIAGQIKQDSESGSDNFLEDIYE